MARQRTNTISAAQRANQLYTDNFGGNGFRYSFSGADARAYAWYPGAESRLILLESMQTVSLSLHEAKCQARALGFRGAKGLARGIRTIAGSMILTVVEDHPLKGLATIKDDSFGFRGIPSPGWSLDQWTRGVGTILDHQNFYNQIATTLPPFNLMVHYVSEGSRFAQTNIGTEQGRPLPNGEEAERDVITTITQFPSSSMYIEGIDIVDSGIVTSVNDIVTEMTFSFYATDYKPISRLWSEVPGVPRSATADESSNDALFGRLYPRASVAEAVLGDAAYNQREQFIEDYMRNNRKASRDDAESAAETAGFYIFR